MTPRPVILVLIALLVAACNGEIYLRDGVTDGDTFYLSQRAWADDDPVLQSWVRYSLARSTCQLENGGDNPARANSHRCELIARRHLLESWQERKALQPSLANDYLDDLLLVDEAGFLDEHVSRHFRQRNDATSVSPGMREYRRWLAATLPGHRPETRLVGSWNYARNVAAK